MQGAATGPYGKRVEGPDGNWQFTAPLPAMRRAGFLEQSWRSLQ
jgi:hypothetical protein